MNIIGWISRRLKLKGASQANDTGIFIAIAGVALAIIIMSGTLAIVGGFKKAITEKVMGFNSQVSVLPAYDYATDHQSSYITASDSLLQAILQVVPDANPSLRLCQPVVLKTDEDFAGLYLYAFDENHDYSFLESSIIDGSLPDFTDLEANGSIVVSQATANSLKIGVGDKVYGYFFVNDAVKQRRYEIAGIYDTGFGEYDGITAYAQLGALQKVGALDSREGSQIDVFVNNADSIESVAANLQQHLINAYNDGQLANLYPVDNVKHTGAIFFNWLNLLDTNVVVIFILMACVAALTLISSMFIIILDRIPTIGLLRALGATRNQIRLIFANMALKIIFAGMIIGNAVALALLYAQKSWQVLKLDPEMYYLKAVPVEINYWWIVLLNLGVIVLSWLILMLPARMAANVPPASSLRFE